METNTVHSTDGTYRNGVQPGRNKAPKQKAPQTDPRKPPAAPPVKVFRFGRVVTRVWANLQPNNEISWRIDPVADYPGRDSHGYVRSFGENDAWDLARGVLRARRWIRRRKFLLKFVSWSIGL